MEENIFKPDCIRTFTGKYVNAFNPDYTTIDIIDVAHSLSMQCRFGGHLPNFYSVAQHSIICSELVPDEYKLTALLHDSTEFSLMDIPKPVKLRLKEYNDIEDNLMKHLANIFGFIYPLPKIIKEVDTIMLHREWNALMLRNAPFSHVLLNQREAKEEFLRVYNQLKKK